MSAREHLRGGDVQQALATLKQDVRKTPRDAGLRTFRPTQLDKFPKQGTMTPWRREQNYARNRRELQRLTFDDPALEFSRAVPAGEPETELAA